VNRIFALIFLVLIPARAVAQTASPPQPPLRRWFEFQQFALSTRYRFIETSADKVTSNDLQYREQVRGRVNFDAKKRYTLNFATSSGNAFISSWDYTGWGINDGDYHNHFVKQLYASAIPVAGLEIQYGGTGIVRGENTEITTYDEDGFMMGERVSLKRPKQVYLDEITVTRAKIGPSNKPNVFDRFKYLDDPDYTQVLGAKRFTSIVAGSLEYERQTGADLVRGAISFRFKPTAPITAARYEQYHRFNQTEASGFAVSADRPITKWVRLSAGYASIDEHYGGLNADRFQRGRRYYGLANVTIWGPLSAQVFATHALDEDYTVSNQTRFDAVLIYDVLNSLRKTGVF
jgi:hypothetical protein